MGSSSFVSIEPEKTWEEEKTKYTQPIHYSQKTSNIHINITRDLVAATHNKNTRAEETLLS